MSSHFRGMICGDHMGNPASTATYTNTPGAFALAATTLGVFAAAAVLGYGIFWC